MIFEKLAIWQKSHQLTIEIYKLTKSFPLEEKFGITSQIQRASSSIPANIVEGYSRRTTKDYLRFLSQARGSLSETQYFLLLARDLKYVPSEKFKDLINLSEEINRMLNSTIITLNTKLKTS